MNNALYVAAILTIAISVAHSYLGERYILMRLFRHTDLPKLFGSDDFTKKTLRFAWHITSVAWLGFAAILILMARGGPTVRALGVVIGATFLLHGLITLVASRGRHLAWPVFLTIGVATIYATRFPAA